MRPSTRFSGSSNPNAVESESDSWGRVAAAAAIFIFAPIPLLVALGVYVTFQFGRVSYKVFWVIVGSYWLVLLGVYGITLKPFTMYFSPYVDLLSQLSSGNWNATFATWISNQVPLGVGVGLIFGTVYTYYRWIRRPVWEDNATLRPTPWEWMRKRRTRKQISKNEHSPDNGMTIGIVKDGRRLIQTDAEAAAHTFMCGSSGSGKTTTLLMHARDAIRRGHGYVYVDLKGGTDVPEQLADFADRYGRRFMHFAIQDSRLPYAGPADGPAYYDPAGRGDPSRRKDLLVGAKKWDVEYYKQVIANYLQTAFRVSALVPPQPGVGSFEDLVVLLQPDRLADRAARIPVTHRDYPILYAEVDRLVNGSEAQERSGIRSMLAYIQTFVGSTAGAWLRKDPEGLRDIDFRRTADEGWVVCFSLDSSNYEESSAAIAGLVVQDLKTLSSELRINPAPRPMNIVLDEFQAIGSDNVLGLIDKCRDANMPVIMSTQAIGNLTAIDDSFVDRVIGIVNCFMIHRANSMADAEIYAGLTGMEKRFKKMLEVEHRSSLPGGSFGVGAATGGGRVEEYDEFRVLPKDFLELGRGEMVYVAKSPNMRVVYPVQVIKESLELSRVSSHEVNVKETFGVGTQTQAHTSHPEMETFGQVYPDEIALQFQPDPKVRKAQQAEKQENLNRGLGDALSAVERAPDVGKPKRPGSPLTMWETGDPSFDALLSKIPDPSSQPAPTYEQPFNVVVEPVVPTQPTPRVLPLNPLVSAPTRPAQPVQASQQAPPVQSLPAAEAPTPVASKSPARSPRLVGSGLRGPLQPVVKQNHSMLPPLPTPSGEVRNVNKTKLPQAPAATAGNSRHVPVRPDTQKEESNTNPIFDLIPETPKK
jgi:hypothetical protein